MLRFLWRKSARPDATGHQPGRRAIDPNAIFPDDGQWASPTAPEPVAVWRIVTPKGVFLADAHAVEIVEGALHLLDFDEQVIGMLEPGQWERVSTAAGSEPCGRSATAGDLDAAA